MISAGGAPGFRESGEDGSAVRDAESARSVAATPPADPLPTFELLIRPEAFRSPEHQVPGTKMVYVRDERADVRIGERTYPCYADWSDLVNDTGEVLHRVRRALVRLESGWSVSLVWGDYTRSTNDMWSHRPFTETPTEVEVGILHHAKGLTGEPWSMVPATIVNLLIERLAVTPTRDLPSFLRDEALHWEGR